MGKTSVRRPNDGMKRIKSVSTTKRQKFDIDSYDNDEEFDELPLLDEYQQTEDESC